MQRTYTNLESKSRTKSTMIYEKQKSCHTIDRFTWLSGLAVACHQRSVRSSMTATKDGGHGRMQHSTSESSRPVGQFSSAIATGATEASEGLDSGQPMTPSNRFFT